MRMNQTYLKVQIVIFCSTFGSGILHLISGYCRIPYIPKVLDRQSLDNTVDPDQTSTYI